MAKNQVYTDPSRSGPVPSSEDQGSVPPEAEEQQPTQDSSAEEQASHSTADFIQNIGPLQEHKRKRKKRRKILIVLVVVIGLGAGAYFVGDYLQNRADKNEQAASENDSSESDTKPADPSAIREYSSSDFDLSFEHPGDWEIDDSEEDVLTLTSPLIKLPDNAGQEVDAKIVLMIVPGIKSAGFPADSATAVRDSDKMTYDSPSAQQREETYLSFMTLNGTSDDGLEAVYITGNNGYTKGDPIARADFENVEPIIWVEFQPCPDGTCSNLEKLAISPAAWDTNPDLKKAFAVLKSLNIK